MIFFFFSMKNAHNIRAEVQFQVLVIITFFFCIPQLYFFQFSYLIILLPCISTVKSDSLPLTIFPSIVQWIIYSYLCFFPLISNSLMLFLVTFLFHSIHTYCSIFYSSEQFFSHLLLLACLSVIIQQEYKNGCNRWC